MYPNSRANLDWITIYSVARLLISNDLNDKQHLPNSGMLKMLVAVFQFRLNYAPGRLLDRVTGRGGRSLVTTFGASRYSHAGLRNAYPDQAHAKES